MCPSFEDGRKVGDIVEGSLLDSVEGQVDTCERGVLLSKGELEGLTLGISEIGDRLLIEGNFEGG